MATSTPESSSERRLARLAGVWRSAERRSGRTSRMGFVAMVLATLAGALVSERAVFAGVEASIASVDVGADGGVTAGAPTGHDGKPRKISAVTVLLPKSADARYTLKAWGGNYLWQSLNPALVQVVEQDDNKAVLVLIGGTTLTVTSGDQYSNQWRHLILTTHALLLLNLS